MERFEKEPLARISDGNLIEKYVDWKESFLARMKEHKFDRAPVIKKMIAELTSHDEKLLLLDSRIGLNAARKQLLVNLMHVNELKLLFILEKEAAVQRGQVDDASSVASTSCQVDSSDASNKDSNEPQDLKKSADDENSESASNGVMCRRCGLFCENYKKCPALVKQCRKCGRMDHFEKMCNEIPIASVSDGDLVDKWIDWKRSYTSRMKQYTFDKSPAGKKALDKATTFGWDILSTDRRIGLNAQRKQEVVSQIYNMEWNLCRSIAQVEARRVGKSDNYCDTSESSKEPTDVVEAFEKLDCSTAKSSPPECKVACLQCGLCCGNYNRCPALGKQCRRCLRNDHYEKMCNSKISTANNQFIYSREIIGQIEVPKKTNLASVFDGNFMEKWFDWKQSYRVRMREHNFESTSRGKEAIDKVSDFGKEIVKRDREFGLKRDRKREVLNLMCKLERNLLDNIARVTGNNEVVDPVADCVDTSEKSKDQEVDGCSDELGVPMGSLCWACGYYCASYKRCPAIGKKCRRCHRCNHYASMCRSRRSPSELRWAREQREQRPSPEFMERNQELFADLRKEISKILPTLPNFDNHFQDEPSYDSDDSDDIYPSDDDDGVSDDW